MGTRKRRQVEVSDSEGSGSDAPSPVQNVRRTKAQQYFSDSSDSDSDWGGSKRKTNERNKPPQKRSSGSESEISSDSESSEDENHNGSLYTNEDERLRIEGMTELARETWIANRSEELQKQRDRKKIQKQLEKSKRQKEREQRKRNDAASSTKKSRPSPPAPSRKSKPVQSKAKAAATAGNVWTDSESESEEEDVKKRSSRNVKGNDRRREASPEPEVTVEDMNSIRLSRHKLELWHNRPSFEEVAIGSFVRMSIGTVNSRSVCRAVEVVGISKMKGTKSYTLAGKPCNQMLVCAWGANRKDFQLKFASNSPFTDREVDALRVELAKTGKKLPSKRTVEKKKDDIKKQIEYRLTNDDILHILEDKKTQGKNKLIIDRTFGAERIMMVQELELALQNNNTADADNIRRKIELLDSKAKDQRTTFKNRDTIAQAEIINHRARQRNVNQANTKTPFDVSLMDGRKYQRVKTRPIMLTSSDKPRMDEEKAAREAAKIVEDANAVAAAEKERQENEAERRRRQSVDVSDLKKLHQFDLDIDIQIDDLATRFAFPVPSLETSASDIGAIRARRTSDFKAKKGLI
eukprot:CFRG0973T1